MDLWGMRFDDMLSGVESRLALVFSQHSPICPEADAARARAAKPDMLLRMVQGAAHPAPWTPDILQEPTRSWTGVSEYARSKLANVLFSAELARRAQGSGVSSFALHPGVVDTDIWRGLPRALRVLNRLRLQPTESGARTTVHCALHAAPQESGLYFADARPTPAGTLGTDPLLARALWERSAQWTGLGHVLPG